MSLLCGQYAAIMRALERVKGHLSRCVHYICLWLGECVCLYVNLHNIRYIVPFWYENLYWPGDIAK